MPSSRVTAAPTVAVNLGGIFPCYAFTLRVRTQKKRERGREREGEKRRDGTPRGQKPPHPCPGGAKNLGFCCCGTSPAFPRTRRERLVRPGDDVTVLPPCLLVLRHSSLLALRGPIRVAVAGGGADDVAVVLARAPVLSHGQRRVLGLWIQDRVGAALVHWVDGGPPLDVRHLRIRRARGILGGASRGAGPLARCGWGVDAAPVVLREALGDRALPLPLGQAGKHTTSSGGRRSGAARLWVAEERPDTRLHLPVVRVLPHPLRWELITASSCTRCLRKVVCSAFPKFNFGR
jgi:hypothetical protein